MPGSSPSVSAVSRIARGRANSISSTPATRTRAQKVKPPVFNKCRLMSHQCPFECRVVCQLENAKTSSGNANSGVTRRTLNLLRCLLDRSLIPRKAGLSNVSLTHRSMTSRIVIRRSMSVYSCTRNTRTTVSAYGENISIRRSGLIRPIVSAPTLIRPAKLM